MGINLSTSIVNHTGKKKNNDDYYHDYDMGFITKQKIKQTIDFCRMLTGQILTCPLDINIHKNRKTEANHR
ncbi:hypothetical protein DERF_001980 [Dermatophagoides farinae]|uniref:Uncharacterized protein n=1 Tax=Dermatophagoides farinae TaxID=6954 RepID=A0A922IBI9_DERFA|nr:hypothetical protein DERF_001980 [Dermatophagoides farinae]